MKELSPEQVQQLAQELSLPCRTDLTVTLRPEDGEVSPELAREIGTIVRALLPNVLGDLSVKVVSGGITNALYYVTGSNTECALRVYGPDTHRVIDRERELRLSVYLSAHGFGKAILGLFGGGRLEAWTEGAPLKPEDMMSAEVSPLVARAMRRFHTLPLPQGLEHRDVFDTMTLWLKQVESDAEIDALAIAQRLRDTRYVHPPDNQRLPPPPRLTGRCVRR
ncbi:MAG: hypothetical protein MHM6MM_004794 [Cercozoa sp. M6MM]